MSSKFGYLGSIDANTGEENVGWDTDQFPMDVKKAMITMQVVMEQGGIAPGASAVGQCQADSNRFGCRTTVKDGKAEATLCID
jgi:xylose isomerase